MYLGLTEASSLWGTRRGFTDHMRAELSLIRKMYFIKWRKWDRRRGLLKKGQRGKGTGLWGSLGCLGMPGPQCHCLNHYLATVSCSSLIHPFWVWSCDLLQPIGISGCEVSRDLQYTCLVWLGSHAVVLSHEKYRYQLAPAPQPGPQNTCHVEHI